MAQNESSRLQTTSDFCKSHSARGEREPCKISPSKLSKKELEDQYYSQLDNNIALKKMVNAQANQVKLLSAKLLRLTTAAKVHGKGNSCCAAARSVIDEQKKCIAELKLSNDKLSEKIKSLNTRLCSAKQYVKRSPLQKLQCFKCSRISLAKNTSTVSAIHTKRSDANIQTSVSCQYYDNMELLSAKSAKTEVSQLKENQCEDNKCKTEMEMLRKEIADLKQELSTLQKDYTEKLTSLEHESSRMQAENNQMRAERNTNEQSAREREELNRALGVRLRDVEARCNDATMLFSLEKKKVLELETQLKSAKLSSQLARTIEEHLSHEVQKRTLSPVKTRQEFKCYSCMKSPKVTVAKTAMDDKPSPIVNVSKDSKYSDDSGFTDPNRCMEKGDGLTLDRINSDLIKRIANLQAQLDELKISTEKQFESNGPPVMLPESNSEENRRNSLNISQNSIDHSTQNSASADKYVQSKTSQIHEEKEINSTPKLKTIVRDKVIKKKRIIEKDYFTNKTEISDKLNLSNEKLPQNNEKLPKSNEKLPKSNKKLPKSNESSVRSNEKLLTSNKNIPVCTENSIKKKNDPVASSSPLKSKSDREKSIPDLKDSGTYSVKKSADLPKTPQAPSPDNTEYEISSISESSGRAKSWKHWSLGERRFSTFSESYTVTGSDSEPLSEGELPFGRRILSVGERPVDSKFVLPFPNPQEPISKKMESTLEAITTELSRCTRLLNSSRLKGLQT